MKITLEPIYDETFNIRVDNSFVGTITFDAGRVEGWHLIPSAAPDWQELIIAAGKHWRRAVK